MRRTGRSPSRFLEAEHSGVRTPGPRASPPRTELVPSGTGTAAAASPGAAHRAPARRWPRGRAARRLLTCLRGQALRPRCPRRRLPGQQRQQQQHRPRRPHLAGPGAALSAAGRGRRRGWAGAPRAPPRPAQQRGLGAARGRPEGPGRAVRGSAAVSTGRVVFAGRAQGVGHRVRLSVRAVSALPAPCRCFTRENEFQPSPARLLPAVAISV